MSELIVRTEALGGSPLARAGMEGRLADWYVGRPSSVAEWKTRVDSVRASVIDKNWLGTLASAFAATGAAARDAPQRLPAPASGRTGRWNPHPGRRETTMLRSLRRGLGLPRPE